MMSLEFRLILEERRQQWERKLKRMKIDGAALHQIDVIEEVIKAYALVLADEESMP